MWLATFFGVGLAPVAPGTFGSVAGALAFVLLSPLGPGLYLLTVLALLALGIWASDAAGAHFGREDDGRIVIDEVVGQLLTLSPIVLLPGLFPGDAPGVTVAGLDFVLAVVTGFVLFRVFDIWKPGPAAWAERSFGGGTGVMMDDVVAGILGAAVLTGGASLLAMPAAS